MFMNFTSGNGNPFCAYTRVVKVRHATAVSVGQVMALDTTLASSSTASGYSSSAAGGGTLGSSTGNSALAGVAPGGSLCLPPDLGYTGIITPLGESATAAQIYCVVTGLRDGTGLDGQDVDVLIQGRVQVNVASATYVAGSLLMMSATESNRNLVALAVSTNAGQRAIAVVEIGGTTVTTATVQFFGLMGLFAQNAVAN